MPRPTAFIFAFCCVSPGCDPPSTWYVRLSATPSARIASTRAETKPPSSLSPPLANSSKISQQAALHPHHALVHQQAHPEVVVHVTMEPTAASSSFAEKPPKSPKSPI